MDELKKPSMRTAILTTAAALLELCCVFFMIASDPKFGLLTVFIFTESMLIAMAIFSWVKYFKQYVDYAIEEKLTASKLIEDDGETKD